MKATVAVLALLTPMAAAAQPAAPMPGGERAIRVQDLDMLREQARTTPLFAGLPPAAVVERKEDLRLGWTVTAFSILWSRPPAEGGERAPHWVARKVEADTRRLRTVYADTRSCPALRQVLEKAERLEPPRPRFNFVGPGRNDELGEIILHDTGYSFSAQTSYANGVGGRVQFSGGSRSPLATWTHSAMRALEPCWTDRVPPVH